MKRHLCVTVLFALVLIPDWAAACWPRWGSPADERAYYVPIYHGPVYVAPQPVYGQPIYVQPCTPLVPPALVPPRVEPAKLKGGNASAAPTPPAARPVVPAKPPEVEAIRPAGGVGGPAAKPEPAPASDLKPPAVDRPKNTDTIPPTVLPMGASPEPKLPPLELPKADPKPPSLSLPPAAGAELKLPPLDLPKAPDAKLPSLELPGVAVPVPAPAPDAPAPAPGLLTPKNPDTLPPLTLPPDTPVTPVKSVEAKSSPLTAARELKVNLVPAAGVAAANGAHKVGFYNYTNRDLALTIEGRAVTLPAMTYLHAQLPATFTWKCADKPAAQAAVPADATGLDVLIRE